MLVSLSQYLEINPQELKNRGVFDTVLNSDSLYFINFMCLRDTNADELADSYDKLNSKFRDIAILLKASKTIDDRFYREAMKTLNMSELEEICLGYAMFGTSGSGSGDALKTKILNTAIDILKAGIEQPEIFQLVGLFEEGIGPDRISDMIGRTIYDDLVKYSKRMIAELMEINGVNKSRQLVNGLLVNIYNGKPLLLLPLDILNELPIASNWDDIDYVCMLNAEVREQINIRIGSDWNDLTTQAKKKLFKEISLGDPNIFREVVNDYILADVRKYDFEKDPLGEASWHSASLQFTSNFPIVLQKNIDSKQDILIIVSAICEQFKYLIENNGLNEILYTDTKKPRKERISQKLFYSVAYSYCNANNLDISPEVNSGRGPVDFKFSYGSWIVLVEVKLTRNTSLLHGYEKQLKEYEKAERTDDAFYLVIDNGGSRKKIVELKAIHQKCKDNGIKTHNLIIIDGLLKDSASHYDK